MGKPLHLVVAFALAVAPSVFALAGCAADANSDPSAVADESSVVSGPLDWSHPAVGTLGACSATLIADDAVLTSSDCAGDVFVVRGDRGDVTASYPVAGTSRVGDLSIAKLASHVPANVATPIDLASDVPAEGARVTVLGYGCTGQRLEDGRKRSASVRWAGAMRAACPGTVVLDADGRALAVRTTLIPPKLGSIEAELR
jgi:hypothetical protein